MLNIVSLLDIEDRNCEKDPWFLKCKKQLAALSDAAYLDIKTRANIITEWFYSERDGRGPIEMLFNSKISELR